MTGFREDIRNKILGAQPHLLVQPGSTDGLPAGDYADRFEGVSGVVAWSPYVMGQALAKSEGGTQGVVVKGVDPNREPAVTGLGARVLDGDLQVLVEPTDAKGPVPILLGKELANGLRLVPGDRVLLAVPGSDDAALGWIPRFFSFQVAGLLQTGLYDYDSTLALVSLPTAQKLFGLKDRYSGLGVRLDNPDAFQRQSLEVQSRCQSSALGRS